MSSLFANQKGKRKKKNKDSDSLPLKQRHFRVGPVWGWLVVDRGCQISATDKALRGYLPYVFFLNKHFFFLLDEHKRKMSQRERHQNCFEVFFSVFGYVLSACVLQ